MKFILKTTLIPAVAVFLVWGCHTLLEAISHAGDKEYIHRIESCLEHPKCTITSDDLKFYEGKKKRLQDE